MDTVIGTCFPIHVVGFVYLKVSSWTQIDLKSEIACILKILIDLCT